MASKYALCEELTIKGTNIKGKILARTEYANRKYGKTRDTKYLLFYLDSNNHEVQFWHDESNLTNGEY